MSRVLYFHGFASSPASAKITTLRPLLAPHDVVLDTPDLNVPSFEHLDWNAMIDLALEDAHAIRPAVLAGSSLGALVALEVARRGVEVPLVLVAPAIGVGARWQTRLPEGDPVMVWNHALNANAPIHRAFFDQMNDVDADAQPPGTRVIVFMGRRDETVPFELVEETWQRWESLGLAPGSRFVVFDEGDHGLTAYVDQIAEAILDLQ
ncbi:MAG TPA: alpha/beta hydrolase family protein [Thermoanaerobaculia bacterium]|nr:alpha/beta hydrolase family protein [Thermoanaerobaculia bacterium]